MSNEHSKDSTLLLAIDNSEACLKAIDFCHKNFSSGKLSYHGHCSFMYPVIL